MHIWDHLAEQELFCHLDTLPEFSPSSSPAIDRRWQTRICTRRNVLKNLWEKWGWDAALTHHVSDSADELIVKEEVLWLVLWAARRVQHPTHVTRHGTKRLLTAILQPHNSLSPTVTISHTILLFYVMGLEHTNMKLINFKWTYIAGLCCCICRFWTVFDLFLVSTGVNVGTSPEIPTNT